ncbi:MAG: hypothetical protein WBN51_09765 [Gammaproteobacteria bacterium]
MRTIRSFVRILIALLLLFVLAVPVVLVVAGIEATPLVEAGAGLSHEDVERIKKLLRQHDPRRLNEGEIRTLSLAGRDLNLILNHAPTRVWNSNIRIDLHPARIDAGITFTLPKNPLGSYLNISAQLSRAADILIVDRFTIGSLRLPGVLINPLLRHVHHTLLANYDDYRVLMAAINGYRLHKDRLVLVYQWNPELADRLQARGKGLLFSAADKTRLQAQQHALAKISGQFAGHRVSLAKILPPLFALAAARSQSAGADPQAENRAALIILAMYAFGIDVHRFIDMPGTADYHWMSLTLYERHDLVQHFLASAAITVSAGSGLAAAAGLFKELDDSRGGTGFSFADLLADRAGVHLAEMATGSKPLALALQHRMGTALKEADFMPQIDQLPEGIMELEFKQRYLTTDSEAYRMVETEIQRRIADCRLYDIK